MAGYRASIRRGRVYVLLALLITLVGDAGVIGATMAHSGLASGISGLVRWGLTLALSIAVWRGHAWARWLMVTLMGIALLFAVPTAVMMPHPVTIGLAAQFLFTVSLLAFPPGVRRFQRIQRERLDP